MSELNRATVAQVAKALAGGFYGASTQNLTASRAKATTYTNTTGRPIFVSARGSINTAFASIYATVGSGSYFSPQITNANEHIAFGFMVMDGETYRVGELGGTFAMTVWTEARL